MQIVHRRPNCPALQESPGISRNLQESGGWTNQACGHLTMAAPQVATNRSRMIFPPVLSALTIKLWGPTTPALQTIARESPRLATVT